MPSYSSSDFSVIFTSFEGPDDADFARWERAVSRLLPGQPDPDDVGYVIWRVISASGSEQAFSLRRYPDLESAREGLDVVRSSAASLEVTLATLVAGGPFAWYLSLDGRPLVGARWWYRSYWGRNRSMHRVREAMADMEIGEALDPNRTTFADPFVPTPDDLAEAAPIIGRREGVRPLREVTRRPIQGVLSREWYDRRKPR